MRVSEYGPWRHRFAPAQSGFACGFRRGEELRPLGNEIVRSIVLDKPPRARAFDEFRERRLPRLHDWHSGGPRFEHVS